MVKIYISNLRKRSYLTREGVSLLGISDAAESIGFRTMGVKVDLNKLEEENVTPFIAHWRQNNIVVVYTIDKNKVYVSDPALIKITYTKDEFLKKTGQVRLGMSLRHNESCKTGNPHLIRRTTLNSLCKKTPNTALFSFLKQSP